MTTQDVAVRLFILQHRVRITKKLTEQIIWNSLAEKLQRDYITEAEYLLGIRKSLPRE
jgi:hypothetical protein